MKRRVQRRKRHARTPSNQRATVGSEPTVGATGSAAPTPPPSEEVAAKPTPQTHSHEVAVDAQILVETLPGAIATVREDESTANESFVKLRGSTAVVIQKMELLLRALDTGQEPGELSYIG